MDTVSASKRLDNLFREYLDFLVTEAGEEWKAEQQEAAKDDPDPGNFGDYLYDFHPEELI